MPEPERRRRRPPVSCTLCRKRKIRCNKELPCNNCLRSKSGDCMYDNVTPQPPQPRGQQEQVADIRPARHTAETSYATPRDTISVQSPASGPSQRQPNSSAATVVGHIPDREVEALRARVKELEAKLSQSTLGKQQPSNKAPNTIETISTGLSGDFHVEHDGPLFGCFSMNSHSRSLIHKNRLFGQSHWVHGVLPMFRDVAEAIEPHVRDESSKAVYNMGKCKALSKVIKARRTPVWPTIPSMDLPSKDVADELIDNYLRTIETLYRILHVPTFKRDYEALWLSGSKPDPEFVVQVKLVMALGSITSDEHFSLRTEAIGWTYEAITWVAEPRFKARLGLGFLQIHILLHIGRETVVNNMEANPITSGSLLRLAMFMGLHRDPTRFPNQSTYSNEMRRRLWNTTLEITLQSSISCGSPLLLTMQDFDTEPPKNLDDDQLMTADPVPKPDTQFTQVTIAREMRKILPLRFNIVRYLNEMGSRNTYEETLKLDKELRAGYRSFCKRLQSFHPENGLTASDCAFAFRAADFMIHRYMSSLHIPYLERAMNDASCAYSRKAALDSALRFWCAASPSSSALAPQSNPTTTQTGEDLLARYIKNGQGFFRTIVAQSSIVISYELQSQLLEEGGLGPVPLRQDLLDVLDDGIRWTEKCFQAGEINPKGYLIQVIVRAKIQAYRKGVNKDELTEILLKAAEEAGETCLGIFEDMVAQGQPEGITEEIEQVPWVMPNGFMRDMDFIISDDTLGITPGDQMNWAFNDNSTTVW